MPVKKTHLTRAEQARYLERAKELQAAQVDCEVLDDWQENFHDLDVFVAPPEANILCELSSGVTAYAICVRLVALRSNLRLESCEIVSDWDSESIVLWQIQSGFYRVEGACMFSEAEVLNDRIENGLCFHHRGDVAEGWLVATGLKPIPDKYLNWMITKLGLTFTDQFGHDYSAHAQAALQRSGGLRKPDSPARKSPGLFEGRGPENQIWSREVRTSTPSKQPEGGGGTQCQRVR